MVCMESKDGKKSGDDKKKMEEIIIKKALADFFGGKSILEVIADGKKEINLLYAKKVKTDDK